MREGPALLAAKTACADHTRLRKKPTSRVAQSGETLRSHRERLLAGTQTLVPPSALKLWKTLEAWEDSVKKPNTVLLGIVRLPVRL